MTRSLHGAALFVAMCAMSSFAAPLLQSDSTGSVRLDQRIGPANPVEYGCIRDAKHWRNPYLVIRADGIEIIAQGVKSGRKVVAVGSLREALVHLPVSAWPYGRAVAVQDVGIRQADRSDDEAIGRTSAAARAILMKLQITIVEWPSA